MANDILALLTGEVLEEDVELTLAELCYACQVPAERVIELVHEGIVEPSGQNPAHWRFRGVSVYRVRRTLRLQQDLGINIAGAALALDLLEEIQTLRMRLRRLER